MEIMILIDSRKTQEENLETLLKSVPVISSLFDDVEKTEVSSVDKTIDNVRYNTVAKLSLKQSSKHLAKYKKGYIQVFYNRVKLDFGPKKDKDFKFVFIEDENEEINDDNLEELLTQAVNNSLLFSQSSQYPFSISFTKTHITITPHSQSTTYNSGNTYPLVIKRRHDVARLISRDILSGFDVIDIKTDINRLTYTKFLAGFANILETNIENIITETSLQGLTYPGMWLTELMPNKELVGLGWYGNNLSEIISETTLVGFKGLTLDVSTLDPVLSGFAQQAERDVVDLIVDTTLVGFLQHPNLDGELSNGVIKNVVLNGMTDNARNIAVLIQGRELPGFNNRYNYSLEEINDLLDGFEPVSTNID